MSDMKAGRELDYLIAEKVMDLPCLRDAPGVLLPIEVQVRNYSTSIAAAWTVFLKLVELSGATVELRQHPIGWTGIKLIGWDKWLTADTAPLAICLAALKAKGVSDDGSL